MKDTVRKAFYAMLGAPVIAYKKSMAFGSRLADVARQDYKEAAQEGEGVAKKVTSTSLADEIGSRVDLEGIQDRVDKLRDQLEDALAQWRDNFRPGDAEKVEKAAPKTAAKPAAKTTTPKTTAQKPAAKTTTRKPAAKTTTRKPAAKTTTKKPAAKTTTKKPAAKTTAKKPAVATSK